MAGLCDKALLRIFWQAASKRQRGNRDPGSPGEKSIERDYLEREQVEIQGGPCHVYNLSVPLSGAGAVRPISAVSGWLESAAQPQTQSSQPPDKPSRDEGSATTSLSPGSGLLCQPPCSQDGPLQSTIRNHLVWEIARSIMLYVATLWFLWAKSDYI